MKAWTKFHNEGKGCIDKKGNKTIKTLTFVNSYMVVMSHSYHKNLSFRLGAEFEW